MPDSHQNHQSLPRRRRSYSSGARALAAVLSATLAMASVVPSFAFAREGDSEGEGSAPPGSIPGLVGPEADPGGEETVLEVELPPGSEEAEEEVAAPAEPPMPLPEEPSVGVEPEPPPPVDAPPTTSPAYEGEAGTPYELAPAPAGVVENKALSAPPPAPEPSSPESVQQEPSKVEVTAEASEPSVPPTEAPLPEAQSQPAATPAERQAPASAPHRDNGFHAVRPGESLWSIATALLPAGASNAEIATEVQRLWEVNEERIGTGDPNLIFVGTALRLR